MLATALLSCARGQAMLCILFWRVGGVCPVQEDRRMRQYIHELASHGQVCLRGVAVLGSVPRWLSRNCRGSDAAATATAAQAQACRFRPITSAATLVVRTVRETPLTSNVSALACCDTWSSQCWLPDLQALLTRGCTEGLTVVGPAALSYRLWFVSCLCHSLLHHKPRLQCISTGSTGVHSAGG